MAATIVNDYRDLEKHVMHVIENNTVPGPMEILVDCPLSGRSFASANVVERLLD